MSQSVERLKPITLYDHLPGILAGYPAMLFALMALISYFGTSAEGGEADWIDKHMMFWIGMSIMIVWYVAFRFNLPKGKFWMLFGLLGTFIGIPVVLELSGIIHPFTWTGDMLGRLAPEVNTGAWLVMAIVFGIIWLGNFIWSRTHLRIRFDH